jgi:predicted secreted protein
MNGHKYFSFNLRRCMNLKSILLILTMAGIITAQSKDSLFNGKISSKAIWQPGMGIMQVIHDSCDNVQNQSFGQCFWEQMKKSGASPEALEFTRLTGYEGFMRDFKNTGKVDIAYAVYPFRANENQLCFLVNGNPGMIDIDGYNYISGINFKADKVYKQIAMEYPNVSVWPGDRSGSGYPAVREIPGGGQQFIFNYRLQDGCHACKLVGYANLGFNFDKYGKFLGIKVINILRLNKSGSLRKMQNEFFNPVKTIKIKAGECFLIGLKSNATTGYEWQLAKPVNEGLIIYAGKIYLSPLSGIPGAGGEEIWNFIPNKAGSTIISFKYSRPWEKNTAPAKKVDFKIVVE